MLHTITFCKTKKINDHHLKTRAKGIWILCISSYVKQNHQQNHAGQLKSFSHHTSAPWVVKTLADKFIWKWFSSNYYFIFSLMSCVQRLKLQKKINNTPLPKMSSKIMWKRGKVTFELLGIMTRCKLIEMLRTWPANGRPAQGDVMMANLNNCNLKEVKFSAHS